MPPVMAPVIVLPEFTIARVTGAEGRCEDVQPRTLYQEYSPFCVWQSKELGQQVAIVCVNETLGIAIELLHAIVYPDGHNPGE